MATCFNLFNIEAGVVIKLKVVMLFQYHNC